MLSGAVQQHVLCYMDIHMLLAFMSFCNSLTHIQGPQPPDSSTATASAIERQPGNRMQRLRKQPLL